MIRPEPCASMWRPAACDRWKTASRLTVSTSSPVLRGVLRGGRATDRAGVVDEDVEAAEFVDHLGDRRGEFGGGRADEIAAHEVHPAAEGADALGGVGGVAAVEQRDVGAGLGERDGGALAESAARAGDEGDLRRRGGTSRGSCGCLLRSDEVRGELADSRDADGHGIAGGERAVGGLCVCELLRRARRDDVAGLERHDLAQVVHDERDAGTSSSTSTATP